MIIIWKIIAFSSILPSLVHCIWGYYQGFAVEPHDVTAVIGRTAIIPCQLSHKQGKAYWSKHEQIISVERNTFGLKRYSIIGSDSDGNYSLKIDPVELLDDGEYRCSVTGVKFTDKDLHSRKVWLSVWIPPKPPVITDAEYFYAMEYKATQLECVSENGNPPASIVWLDNRNFTITENVAYTYTPDQYGITYTAVSTLTFEPKYTDNNTNYTCRAQNSAEETFQSATVRLNILFTPIVHIEIMSYVDSEGFVPSGSDVTFFCRAEANPSKVRYSWYLDSFLVSENGTSELMLPKVGENHNRIIVKCCVNNSLGESSSFLELRVRYGPEIRYIQEEVQDKKGANVTLKCDVIGNPPPTLQWTHLDTLQVVGNESTLFIILDEYTQGKYECLAKSPRAELVKRQVLVILLNPPDIVSSKALQDSRGNAWLECVVSSLSALNKPPSNITWIYNGNAIKSLDEGIIIQETKFSNHTLKSILLIQDVQPQNYGTYLCTASNSNGVTSTEVLLFQPSIDYNKIFISIVIILFIIVTFICVYFLCRQRYKKYFVYKINEPNITKPRYRITNEVNSNFMGDSVLSDATDHISPRNSSALNCNLSSIDEKEGIS